MNTNLDQSLLQVKAGQVDYDAGGLPATAHATKYRMPSTCHSGCMIVTAYRDVGGVKDWNCGSVVYSGHKGTEAH